MSSESPPIVRRWVLPWRSATAGWVVATLTLLAGVPLFLCMPPWVDVTLYDMAARSILRGGVYYRDVFDTNLPGVTWVMASVRFVFGWSYETLRAFDLLVIAAEVALLIGWVRKAGGSAAAVAWFAAAAAMFYLGTSEFNHIQRDPWMLLPAVVAARLRLNRVQGNEALASHGVYPRGVFQDHGDKPRDSRSSSFLEGLAWGVAVWIKPHVVIPAFAFWLASVVLLARREPRRRLLADFGGLLLGGLVAGGRGLAWLVGTGAWPYFREVFLEWNPNYMSDVFGDAPRRFVYTFEVFRPWGLLHALAMPLALLAFWEGRLDSWQPGNPRRILGSPWVYSPAESDAVASARLLLAALYLGWLLQMVVFQRGFEYVQVPVLLLGMAVIATQRWAFGFVYLLWFVFLGVLLNFTKLVPAKQHPAPGLPAIRLEHYEPFTNPHLMKLWPRCLRQGSTPEMRDRTGHYIRIHCGTNWEELDDVARFLRTIEPPLGPGELNCWHDSTHSLYLTLNLAPATRYMHYGTVFAIPSKDDWIRKRIAKEVRESPQRYVVADLVRMGWRRSRDPKPPGVATELRLPGGFPDEHLQKFPWNQKLVFRSGRYVVFEVVNPLGEIDVPDWDTLSGFGPGE